MLVLKYLSDNNSLILFGTNTASAPTHGNQPGHNGYWELKLMKEENVPLSKTLSSGTINNAKAYHLDSILGSLIAGKKVKIVLLTNPLKKIEAYNSIEKVVIGGKVIKREDLGVKK
jgi:imidazolonepropionase-like amidohydrolase